MRRLSYEEFATLRAAEDLRVIDVREQEEYDTVRVRGVELFPLSRLQRGELPEPDGRTIALICRSGARSAFAGQLLESHGFDETINVEGGTLAAMGLRPEDVERG